MQRILHNDLSVNLLERYITNIYACTSKGAPKYMKQILTELNWEIDSNTVIVDINTPLLIKHRSTRQKINRETENLHVIGHLDLTDIYRKLHPSTAAYIFFSSTHRTSSRIGHRSDHKTILNKFKKIEIIPNIFSNHSVMKLEINCKWKTGIFTNMWRLNNTLLSN